MPNRPQAAFTRCPSKSRSGPEFLFHAPRAEQGDLHQQGIFVSEVFVGRTFGDAGLTGCLI